MVAESLQREIRDLRALLFSPRDPEGRGFAPLADALRRAGDLGQALELVEEGVARLPEFATGHVVAGWIHRARGEDGEAEHAFRRVLELDDENVSALRGLGFLLAERGAGAEAREVFRRLDDLEPGDPEVRARLLELGRGDPEEEPEGEPVVASARTEAAAGDAVPIGSLAPDAAERPLVPIGTLAPAGGEADARSEAGAVASDERPVVDIGDLSPGGPVVDVETLAPDGVPVEASAELGGEVVPDGGVVSLPAPDPETVAEGGGAEAEGPWTRTMAELLVRQGLTDRAVRIYRRLAEESPGDEDLRARLRELEGGPAGETPDPAETEEVEVYVPPVPDRAVDLSPEKDDARLEDLARHMAAGPEMADEPEGPFAWGGAPGAEEEVGAGPTPEAPVSEYFRTLLAWRPRGDDSAEDGEPEGAPGTWGRGSHEAGDGGPPTSDAP